MEEKFDVVVAGGGHAGCEAALAGARMGCSTLLITFTREKIGFLSCNPAVGGVGKGQLVKEVDALGGEIAKAADAAGIQFRTLNTSKGPAVWSSRVQVDRKKYSLYIQKILEEQKNLKILEGEVTNLVIKNKTVTGIEVNNEKQISGKTVILTPGTFLNGLIHIGFESFPAGRIEEKKVSVHLANSLKGLGFDILRFKTGTCARLDGKTINFENLKPQYGDEPPMPFSFSTKKLCIKQVPCYITHTNEVTHQIIRKNLDSSPLFTGKITGTGVRYCPSLEDKVIKFPHHLSHHVFLEPEGIDEKLYYPNGISTSLPEKIQDEFIRTIEGLENVKIIRYGYGIEHDVINPTQIFSTMETKLIQNLFFAGQINGTTGYEEAAAQGLIAGINASLKIKNKSPFIPDRTTSYIGVLLDDLVTKGTNEPYRMFTSRVEYRLLLREDNADLRLRESGYKTGLVSKKEWDETRNKKEKIEEAIKYLKNKKVSHKGKNIALYQLLISPEVKIMDLKEKFKLDFSDDVLLETQIQIKYAPYIQKQLAEIKNFRNIEKIKIPSQFDYNKIPGLSLEIREKLTQFKPSNLGQASRISGITPSAITILMVYLKKWKEKNTTGFQRI